ncbi:hypothetical protein LZG04_11035 [Saccharothrix sp. S26]|uniref:hypothetical protein n=1 Tax=Saccharothrix sp. S26 TaxID=2907215 RepID=UPI001F25248B|nr:hypothetical protein [Saccharothrix sp. S26]MCE6995340.1 hypothetical protein [Saccharothrix sp. S26]
MANRIGYRNFTVVPYTRRGYWTEVKDQLGSLVDRVYLQCYAGGDHNAHKEALDEWAAAMGGMHLDPGLWCRHGDDCGKDRTPDQVREKLRTWADAGAKMSGGFIWYYDDIRKCERKTGFTAEQYAEAVKTATAKPLLHS